MMTAMACKLAPWRRQLVGARTINWFSSSSASSDKAFDLLVIGGGSGGVATARRAAQHGARVALIEKARLGGTCVNMGCVPKKIMYHAADLSQLMQHEAFHYGFSLGDDGRIADKLQFDWHRLKQSRDAYIKRLNGIYERNLVNANVELMHGIASFGQDGQVVLDGKTTVNVKNVLIAVGGKPFVPEIPGKELFMTSDDFFELDEMPRKVAVMGAGYIGVELAGVMASLGIDTTLFIRKNSVLRSFDEMIQSTIMEELQRNGVHIVSDARISQVKEDLKQNGTKTVVLDKGTEFGGFDQVFSTAGRVPVTSTLQLANAGVEMDAKGYIQVDEFQTTSNPNVFAVGDACGQVALTPVAIAAGRRLADRLFGGKPNAKLVYENIPSVVFSHPPIGAIGLTEVQARKKYAGQDIKIYTSRFVNLFYGIVNEVDENSGKPKAKPSTCMKLICVGKEERIVGLHVIGMAADEMLQGFGVAVKMGATKADFDNCVAIHPTAAEEFVTMAPWGLSGGEK